MKKIVRIGKPILLGFVGLALILQFVVSPAMLWYMGFNSIKPTQDGPQTPNPPPTLRDFVINETFTGDISENWRTYQNWHGEVIPMPTTNLKVMEGTQRLEIQHDARYGEFKKKYNNAFTLSRASFQPTALLKVVLQWTMKVDRNYIGSTGLWAHKSDIFLEDGRMGTDGFTWAFGVNFLSNHSWTSGISGLTFTYVEKWVPKCTIYVPDVDPTVENTYRIEWTTTEWRAYVNDVYYGSCPVSQIEPAIVQTWADNSWVPHILLALLRLNPQGPQGTVYGPVQVWYEPTD